MFLKLNYCINVPFLPTYEFHQRFVNTPIFRKIHVLENKNFSFFGKFFEIRIPPVEL